MALSRNTRNTAGGVTAAAASATETDPDVEMDPVPAVTAPPTAEHISPFLLHIRQSTTGSTTTTESSGASGADTDMACDQSATHIADAPRPAHSPADDGRTISARSARAALIPSPKKRRSSCGSAHEARREAFYATAASTTGTDRDVDTDPVPTAPPTAGHVSSFLLHIRGRAADMAAGTAPPAADGATAVAASTTGVGMAAGMGARASVATNDANASGASGAVTDMDVNTADAPADSGDMDVGAVATPPVTAARTRTGRGKGSHGAQGESAPPAADG